MPDAVLDTIAKNIIGAFLLMFCLSSSEGDSTEIKNEGPYRVYSTQAKIPPGTVIDMEILYQKLSDYLEQVNAVVTAPAKFYPHHIDGFRCPCGCGNYLYITFYTC